MYYHIKDNISGKYHSLGDVAQKKRPGQSDQDVIDWVVARLQLTDYTVMDQQTWEAEQEYLDRRDDYDKYKSNSGNLNQILQLEQKQHRCIRDHLLSNDPQALIRLQDLEDQIAVLRSKLQLS